MKKMKVKGLNKLYDVEIERKVTMEKPSIVITLGNLMTGMITVAISEKDWDRIKKEV